MASLDSSNSQHKELASAHVERDNKDFLNILTWFRNHNPFTASEELVYLYGYNKSTKDATHRAESNKMSQIVEISDGDASP